MFIRTTACKVVVERGRPYESGPFVLAIEDGTSQIRATITAEQLRELVEQIKEVLASGQSENL